MSAKRRSRHLQDQVARQLGIIVLISYIYSGCCGNFSADTNITTAAASVVDFHESFTSLENITSSKEYPGISGRHGRRSVIDSWSWTTPSSRKVYVNVSGDFILGALFPIHRRGSGLVSCESIQPEDGIQPLEAMLYSIETINANPDILPGITLGALALDSCDSSTYALEQSLDFLKGFIAHYNEHHETEFHCSDGSPAKFRQGKFDKIVGVIGGQSSSVSIQVANLLRLFQVPQVSYMSTSPLLSSVEKFPYFFRTVPSDVNQAKAILHILQHFNWTYVAVIYSDSDYGVHCFETLKDLSSNVSSICFSSPFRIIRDQFKSDDYDQIIRTIKSKEKIRVIVLILEKEYVSKLMQSANRANVSSQYVWIGTDAWNSKDSDGQELHVEGSIAIQPYVSHVPGFDEYFTSLNLSHARVNPWFEEFWEATFRCKLPSTPSTKFNAAFSNTSCAPNQTLSTKDGIYKQQSYIHFIRDAVYAYAYALNDMHKELCNGVPGVCKAMKHVDGLQIVQYLKNVSFQDDDSNTFRFENGRDGPTRYTIVNFQWVPETLQYDWVEVGNYSPTTTDRNLILDEKKIRYRNNENWTFPTSSCSPTCTFLQVKVREREESCCWKCITCGEYQVKRDEFLCDDCETDQAPDANRSKCIQIPEKYIDYRNKYAIGAMGVASLGILTTGFVTLVFWAYNDTPIIKAAGRELSYVLLLGIFLSFSVTFVIVAEPSPFTCGTMRFFMGFCPTLCYAAIVTKTNRIARIFHHKPGMSTPKTKYISPLSQMIIVSILTSIEIVVNIAWIMWDPPRTSHFAPDRGTRIRICAGVETYSYIVGYIYPCILIGFCTVYAIQTRKCPGGFNETKYIAFTNYTIIIIWLAFVPLYIASTSNSIRVVTLAISLSLSGFVELGCLFFPKLYIVLFKPEKNTKEVVMAPNRSSFLTLSNGPPHTNSSSNNGGSHFAHPQHYGRPHSASHTPSDNGIVMEAAERSVSRTSSEASC